MLPRSSTALPIALILTLLSLGALAPAAEAKPDFRSDVSKLELTVAGELATGLLVEPRRRGNKRPHSATELLTFAHGHNETAASFRPRLRRIVRQTGAAAVAMDFRGPPGHYNLWAGYEDTVAATRWYMDRNPGVERSVIWGWSMGGAVSGMAAAYDSELYDSWVGAFPLVNSIGAWILLSAVAPDDAAEMEADTGCPMPECPEEYAARSPSLLADQIDLDRVVLLHAVDDFTVPIEQTQEMRSALIAAGVPVSTYTFDSGGHGRGPVGNGAERATKRLLRGVEPDDGAVLDYRRSP